MMPGDTHAVPLRLRALAWSVGAIADTMRLLRARWAEPGWVRSLGAAYDTLPCGIVVLNHRGEIVSINDAARRLLALSDEAARGRFLARALRHPLLHADGSPLSVEEYPGIRALRTRQPVPAMTVAQADGAGHRWLRVEATPLLGPAGRVGAVVTLSGAVEPKAKAGEGFHPGRESAA